MEMLYSVLLVVNEESFTIIDEGNNEVQISFSDHPSLETINGISSLDSIDFDSQGILLYRKSTTEIIALSRNCTHAGCQIGTFEDT